VTLTASAVAGDVTLDGMVNITDLGALASNWQATGPSIGWGHGDFTLDHAVNITDLGALASNWQHGAPITAVPEPMTLLLLCAAAAGALLKRRPKA